MSAQVLVATWREYGVAGCARKLRAAVGTAAPLLLRGRRTARGVGSYFDLITDEARRFYGDSFHLGYFARGDESLAEALEAHTDLVARLARIEFGQEVLDVGCGIGEPAARIAARYGCRVTGVNISREQVRQGRELVYERGVSDRVTLQRSDARSLRFADASFDSVVCMEAAGDICVTDADKDRLASELFRVLRPGGHLGFSDMAFRIAPTQAQDRILRALLYHTGSELTTDWPSIFERQGFRLLRRDDIHPETLLTWTHAQAVYERQHNDVVRRYGRCLASRTLANLRAIPDILRTHATFPALSAQKP